MKYLIGIDTKDDVVNVEINREIKSIVCPTYEQYMFFRVKSVRCIFRGKGCLKSDVVEKYQEISCNSFNLVFLGNDDELVIYCYGDEKNNLTWRVKDESKDG